MANDKPDEKHLPTEKKNKLADKVAETIHREVTREHKNLRDREVSVEDANDIIGAGIRRGVDKVNKDMGF